MIRLKVTNITTDITLNFDKNGKRIDGHCVTMSPIDARSSDIQLWRTGEPTGEIKKGDTFIILMKDTPDYFDKPREIDLELRGIKE